MMQAIGINFPTATVKGCFYLFAQAIWKKFKQLAIKIATRSIRKKVTSLAFVVSLTWMGWIKGHCS